MLTEATCSFVLTDTTPQFIRSWCQRVSSLAPHNMQDASSKISSLRWECSLREQCPVRNTVINLVLFQQRPLPTFGPVVVKSRNSSVVGLSLVSFQNCDFFASTSFLISTLKIKSPWPENGSGLTSRSERLIPLPNYFHTNEPFILSSYIHQMTVI